MYECFPDVWWRVHEPHDRRPSPEVRNKRLVKRLTPLLTHHPSFIFVIARIASSGEFAGCAGWHKPTQQWSRNIWLCDVWANKGNGAWQSGYPWDENELKETWEAVNVETWMKECGGYERVRKEEMGDEPHW